MTRRARLAVGVLFICLVGAGVTVALTSGGGSSRGERDGDKPAWADGQEAPNAGTERAREGKDQRQAKFERDQGGEARREGPKSPAAEQVGNRAFPRSYVDDRLAVKSRKAFSALPGKPAAASFGRARSAFSAALDATAAWSERGPKTPNVPGPDSQFFDPTTQTGPATQESGRVTALAVDPACGTTPGDCKMWIAAAGGGIWRTNDALAAHPTWIAPPSDLPTNAFGSLVYDSASQTLYAGSGEPSGSSDSEAGLGLFKSTDAGATWSVVPGSQAVATDRAIGAILVDPNDPQTIYIGTALARHGSSSVNGGRRTPPNAPPLGVYKSTDGGAHFTLDTDLAGKTPADPTPPETGGDFFAGGITKLELDPNDDSALYASVLGYGIWRSVNGGAWTQVFHTMNQSDFTDPANPLGDSTGDVTQFDLVDAGAGVTRAYVGDASDDWAADGDATTAAPEAWRIDDPENITGDPTGALDNATAGWTKLSTETNGKKGFAVSGWCQNGQCSYDSFVAHPPGAPADTVWFGGSMNYDELPEYDQGGTGQPPRSNGRAVIRTTNGGAGTSTTADDTVSWQDMTAILKTPIQAWGVKEGIHPDLHTIGFADLGRYAFIGSDGGIVRIDTHTTQDQSASCAQRQYAYDPNNPNTLSNLNANDLADCQELLNGVPQAVTAVNDGLADLQFQSVSFNPKNPAGDVLGGTQDNGTWGLDTTTVGTEVVGGDGGQSGFNPATPNTRFHNYFDATPEVNFHGNDPTQWLDIYDPLQLTPEARSFYVPFVADQTTPGRLFTGLESVWRTNDNGGSEADLGANGCNALQLDPNRANPCGDWQSIGANLTTGFGGDRSGDYIVALTRAPSDANTLWAATRPGRIFVTSEAGRSANTVSFFRIDTPDTPGRFASGISVDPSNPNHAFISYSGYNAYTPDTPGHVFEVTYDPASRTAAFTDRSYNLGDQPVTGVQYDKTTGDLYASTDFGVTRLAAGSTQWADTRGGLPKVAVYGLTLSTSGRLLYAATHGRGVWTLALPTPAPPPGKPTGRITGPSKIQLGVKATYRATGSTPNGGSVRFSWVLPGKPKTATGTPVSFTPNKRGRRAIVLTVSDNAGQSTVVTKTITVVDTRRPKVTLGKVGTVRLGKASAISGRATDISGIGKTKLSFGDGSVRTVHLNRSGRFTVHHTYRKAKTYRVTFAARDKAGNTGTARTSATVQPKQTKKRKK